MDQGFKDIKKIIAPAGVEVHSNYLKIGDKLVKTFFILSYPRYLATGWFESIINLPNIFDVAIYINPVDTGLALKRLRKKTAQIESQISDQQEKGMVRDPMLETALSDVENLRDTLQQSQEKFFSIGVYIAVYADTLEELARLEGQINSPMEAKLIYLKPAVFQELEGLLTVLPLANDQIQVTTPMNSAPIASFFPFVSEDLTTDQGIMYGINRHDSSLVIFDRFSLENANQVVFAKSGSGKSYSTKLEIIRYLMMGTDILVIDPENEYERLADAFGGSFFNISLTSSEHINPFDIPIIPEGESPSDVLRSHIVNLAGLMKLMFGGALSVEEDALMDRAITETYASREIVPGEDFSHAQPPLLEDLETVLRNLEGGRGLAERLYKFTKGSFAGFLNQPFETPPPFYRRGMDHDEERIERYLPFRACKTRPEILSGGLNHHSGRRGLLALSVRPPDHHQFLHPASLKTGAGHHGHRGKVVRPYRGGKKYALDRRSRNRTFLRRAETRGDTNYRLLFRGPGDHHKSETAPRRKKGIKPYGTRRRGSFGGPRADPFAPRDHRNRLLCRHYRPDRSRASFLRAR